MTLIKQGLELSQPTREDGYCIHQLIENCAPLDKNSIYTYLLLAEHFAHTCVVARHNNKIVGFVSAYLHPEKKDVLFVWQVAVHKNVRKMGVAQAMLNKLLERPNLCKVRLIETTISLGNAASHKMFKAFAKSLEAQVKQSEMFDSRLFGSSGHETEQLITIGPFCSIEMAA